MSNKPKWDCEGHMRPEGAGCPICDAYDKSASEYNTSLMSPKENYESVVRENIRLKLKIEELEIKVSHGKVGWAVANDLQKKFDLMRGVMERIAEWASSPCYETVFIIRDNARSSLHQASKGDVK